MILSINFVLLSLAVCRRNRCFTVESGHLNQDRLVILTQRRKHVKLNIEKAFIPKQQARQNDPRPKPNPAPGRGCPSVSGCRPDTPDLTRPPRPPSRATRTGEIPCCGSRVFTRQAMISENVEKKAAPSSTMSSTSASASGCQFRWTPSRQASR